MKEGGKLTLTTTIESDRLKVEIIDSGSGIPTEIKDKIFEAFFTTKPMGEGSGLGLHICKNIIDKHNGSIDVESQPGQTKFSVWLPVSG